MRRPPTDPRSRPLPPRSPRQSVLVSWAMMAAVALLVWAVSHPWLAALALAALGGAAVVGPHVRRLARCVSTCRRITLSLGRYGHVTFDRTRCCPPGCP